MHTPLRSLLRVTQTLSLPYRRFSNPRGANRQPAQINEPRLLQAPADWKVGDTAGWKACATRWALGLVLVMTWTSSTIAGGVKTGDTFPDIASYKLEGTLPTDTKGKVVLVDFWASWCEPCKQSFPVMEELHKRYGERGLVIIAVNVDENRPDMEDFLKKNAATFTVVRDAKQKLVEKAGIATMPSSFLIDRDGKVRFTHTGFRGAETRKKYEEEIEALLK